MKRGSINNQRVWVQLGLMLAALLLAPALLAAEEAPLLVLDHIEEVTALAATAQVSTAAEAPEASQVHLAGPQDPDCEHCWCVQRSTPPTTRVGATCLRARQNAAAAARTLAVCPATSTGSCGPTMHTVAPCQALSTGGFSATAVATYHCEFCADLCPDTP